MVVCSERVAPGERLAFRASSAAGGQLVIAGIDGGGEPYLCYPQATEGASMPLAPGAQSRDLGEAIELDEKPGRERIVAVLCPEPFHYRQLAGALSQRHTEAGDGPLTRLLEGCSQHEITLQKESSRNTP